MLRKQDLVSLGVTKFNGLFYVDGAALEESKIYVIATSDQLAFETSDYPQFAQVDLVSPTVFTGWDKQTYDIAQLVSVPLLHGVYPVAANAKSPASCSSPAKTHAPADGNFPIRLPRCAVVAGGLQLPAPAKPPKDQKTKDDPFKDASQAEMAVQKIGTF